MLSTIKKIETLLIIKNFINFDIKNVFLISFFFFSFLKRKKEINFNFSTHNFLITEYNIIYKVFFSFFLIIY